MYSRDRSAAGRGRYGREEQVQSTDNVIKVQRRGGECAPFAWRLAEPRLEVSGDHLLALAGRGWLIGRIGPHKRPCVWESKFYLTVLRRLVEGPMLRRSSAQRLP